MWGVFKTNCGDIDQIHVEPISEKDTPHNHTDNCWCDPTITAHFPNGNQVWTHNQIQ